MFFFAGYGGWMATANLSRIAKTLHVSDAKILGLAIVPLAVTLTSLCNAGPRIVWGTVSDWLGREQTMFLTFGIEAVLIFLVTKFSGSPIAFLVLFALFFFVLGRSVFFVFQRRRVMFSPPRTPPPTMVWCIRTKG